MPIRVLRCPSQSNPSQMEAGMPRKLLAIVLPMPLILMGGCGYETVSTNDYGATPAASQDAPTIRLVGQTVEASCGECQFDMEGTGCDLAVRIDGNAYYVDGSSIDEHGDAHSEHGMCNSIRKAIVTGEIKDDRFAATSFKLLPTEIDSELPEHGHAHTHSGTEAGNDVDDGHEANGTHQAAHQRAENESEVEHP